MARIVSSAKHLTDADLEEQRKKPKGKLHPDNFPSFTQWESACAGVYGGVFSQWPEWAKTVLKSHYGYMPKG